MNGEVSQSDAGLDETPEGWQRRWVMELQHAKKLLEKFYASGEVALKAYMDVREARAGECEETHWTLFTSNTQTKEEMLFGSTPKVVVTRRFSDAADDVARVAGEMLQRILNSDIEKDGSSAAMSYGYAFKDRMVPGLGQGRVRYTAQTEDVPGKPPMQDTAGNPLAPEVPPSQRVAYECAETDFVHWRDYLWNADARVWPELRWVAFRAELGRKALETRFGKEKAALVPFRAGQGHEEGKQRETPWQRAEVWEVWDKETRQVFWVVEGMPRVLDMKPDTLGLADFFPCPLPMLATTTTSSMVPRNDYALAQDQYREVNEYSTRIALLTRALRVAGAYDKSVGADLSRLMDGSTENILIPVDRWAAFAEKGGIRGAIEFLPLSEVAATIAQLDERRRASVEALYQITGMSDVVRGQQVANGTPGEARVKARFASVRMQKLQDELARWVTDLQKLKAEIISRHFSVQSIIQQSNIMATPDAPYAMEAAQLLKSDLAKYRIEVKPESLALADFAEMREERTSMLTAIGTFLSATAPLAQAVPGAAPYLMEMLKWFVSGLRGASQIEGVLDSAIKQAQRMAQAAAAQPQQQPPPDPKLQVQLVKGQQDLAKIEAETKSRVVELQAETAAHAQQEATQRQENVREAAQKQLLSNALRPMPPTRPGGMP